MIYSDEAIWSRIVFFGSEKTVGQCVTALYEVETGEASAQWNLDLDSVTLKYPVFDLKPIKFGNRELFLQFAGTPGTSHPMYFASRLLIMKKTDVVVICCNGEETQLEKEQMLSELCNIMERLELTAEWTKVIILFQKQISDPVAAVQVFIDGLQTTGRLLSQKDILTLEKPSATYSNVIQSVREFLLYIGQDFLLLDEPKLN